MSEDAAAPSNGADVAVQPDAGPVQPSQPSAPAEPKPSATTREALDKAFATIEQRDAAPDQKPKIENRDPATGQFTPKDKAEAKPAEVKPAEVKPEAPKEPPKPIPAPADFNFSKAAQEAWAQTPDVVRAEVERRVGELTQGIQKYKASADAFEPVRRYDEMARQSGTTLDAALANYTSIDAIMQRDPVAGVVQVCHVMGLDPRAVAAAIVNAQQLPQPVRPQPAQPQQPDKVAGLEKTVAELRAEMIIRDFKVDHPYFDDLSDSISQMLETRFAKDLPDAYEKAIRLHPEIAAKIEADKAAKAAPPKPPEPDRTQDKAKLSVTGAPSAGSQPATRKPAGSAREAVDGAFARLGL